MYSKSGNLKRQKLAILNRALSFILRYRKLLFLLRTSREVNRNAEVSPYRFLLVKRSTRWTGSRPACNSHSLERRFSSFSIFLSSSLSMWKRRWSYEPRLPLVGDRTSGFARISLFDFLDVSILTKASKLESLSDRFCPSLTLNDTMLN